MAAKSLASDDKRPARYKKRSEGYITSIKERQEIARSNDDFPGYKASECLSLGYPILKVDASIALTIKKRIPTIDEMVLRLIDLGIVYVNDMAAFMGIDASMVEDHATHLADQEQIRRASDNVGTYYELMTAGRNAVRELQVFQSRTESYGLFMDPNTLRVVGLNKGGVASRTILPKTCKERGVEFLVDGSDLEFPKAHEINIGLLEKQLNSSNKGKGKYQVAKTVQCITEMSGYQTRFLPFHVVIYEPDTPGDPTFKLIYEGPSKNEIREYLDRIWWPAQKQFYIASPVNRDPIKELTREVIDRTGVTSISYKDADAREKTLETRIAEKTAILKVDPEGSAQKEIEGLRNELSKVKEEKAQAIQDAQTLAQTLESVKNSNSVKVLEWHEHGDILADAIKSATERLLIVSPWIRSRIVDDFFINNLRISLGNGAVIRIIYGMPSDGRHEGQQTDVSALEDLEYLKKYGDIDTVDLSSLGGTHEKILILDSNYFISTSHNWLSFSGKGSRRRETGTLVTDKNLINSQWDKYMSIFNDAKRNSVSKMPSKIPSAPQKAFAPQSNQKAHGKFPRRK